METNFRNRPLRAIAIDEPLRIDQEEDQLVLERSVQRGFNVLLAAEPGGGASSLLNFTTASLEDRGVEVARMSAVRSEDATDLLQTIARELPMADSQAMEVPKGSDRLEAAYQLLARRSAAISVPTVVVVDDMGGRLGHSLFGRLRDELWGLNLTWIVSAHTQEEATLRIPPADAFFDTVHHLRSLSPEEIGGLLRRRDPQHVLDSRVRSEIAKRCQGNPARALQLAREAEATADPMRIFIDAPLLEQISSRLGEPAARLADELARTGPGSPSDPELLRRLNWSRPRAYQVFQQLERAGFVIPSSQRTGRPGRPRKIYRLAETT
jgi:hypothetical protein